MKELRSEIVIAAPPELVWELLTDFDSYPSWNPFIRSIAVRPAEGETLEARIGPPGGRVMRFRPTVLKAEAPRELRWLGRLFLPGVFDGEHIFTIEPSADGGSRFVQRERFTGILVPLVGGMLRKTEQGFVAMNQALKQRAEARPHREG
jgi:hypothetical protein